MINNKDLIYGSTIIPEYRMEFKPLTDAEIKQIKWAKRKEAIYESFFLICRIFGFCLMVFSLFRLALLTSI